MNRVDDLAFAVVLRELQGYAEFFSDNAQPLVDLRECRSAVQLGLARPEQVEVGTVYDGDVHGLRRRLTQFSNSLSVGVPAGSGIVTAIRAPDSGSGTVEPDSPNTAESDPFDCCVAVAV
jgi:hypothetical protein